MESVSEKIGILGGAFDPIHLGHLILAQSALDELQLQRVLFVPSFQPPHQHKIIGTDFDHRVTMVKKAINGNRAFHCLEIERELEPPTYTVKVLDRLRLDLPQAEFYFLMGADSLEQVDTWFQPDKILKLARFVVAARDGHRLQSTYPFTRLEMPLINICATQLRERSRAGHSLRYLVPDSVISYIAAQKLYRED